MGPRGGVALRDPRLESPTHVQADAVEVLRARLVEVVPEDVVAPLEEELLGQLRADARRQPVGELRIGVGGLPRVADVAVPRIPPAGPGGRARRDVRVDPAPADAAADERRDAALHDVVLREELEVARVEGSREADAGIRNAAA